jgi:peptidylprolyl isomerase/peptidyl-prolyl cis-trans isomerase C
MMTAPQQPYLYLKLALELFKKSPETLSTGEASRLKKIVGRQTRIEAAILGSQEALDVVVPESVLAARFEEIRQRYPNHEEFLTDMRRNHLDARELEAAIARDLCIEAVLERVAAQTPEISETEAERYYHQHPQAFTRPEMRRIRHILITFNDAAQKKAAISLLETLRVRIETEADFAAAALKHSQCPTALEEGVIGVVKPGQLFPELEAPAFALAEGELSAPLESSIGIHLLRCDTIVPSMLMEFSEARERLISRLMEQRRQASQQDWIRRQLKREAGLRRMP